MYHPLSQQPQAQQATVQAKGLSKTQQDACVLGQMRCSNSQSQEFGVQMRKGALLETPFPALLPVAPGMQTGDSYRDSLLPPMKQQEPVAPH